VHDELVEAPLATNANGSAAAQLKKWGRFRIVRDKQTADLILLLSADPYNGGYIIFASGQTGTVDADGHIQQDRIPNYNRLAPVRDAYLTVIAQVPEKISGVTRTCGEDY
jgi:hypothetical protein